VQKSLLGVEEVAERLHVSIRHVRRLVFERRIPFLKIGSLLRFDPEEVEGWLSTLRVDVRDHALRPSWDSARDHAHAVGRPSSSPTRTGPLEEAISMRSESPRSE
jgi:excisionase family DNA binding protein